MSFFLLIHSQESVLLKPSVMLNMVKSVDRIIPYQEYLQWNSVSPEKEVEQV